MLSPKRKPTSPRSEDDAKKEKKKSKKDEVRTNQVL
jgi:hypothetical protein